MTQLVWWTISLLCASRICLAQTGQNPCYYPNRGGATHDYPCDPDAKDDVVCCGGSLGAVCLTNKLCRSPEMNIIRGSCTDQNRASRGCAGYCLSANTGGTHLISCTNTTYTDTSYCCDHTNNCCDTGVGRFDVLPTQPEVWASWDAKAFRFVVHHPLTSNTTAAIPSQPSRAPNSTSTSTSTPSSLTISTGAWLGIGIAAAAIVLLSAAVMYLSWRLYRNKNGNQKTLTESHMKQVSEQNPPPYQ
ncbi:hypothetical protein B0T22DRAFT_465279 [Podospora appendiculata]|uniref:Mid2 domain-containing protein n=1 Tax=Podospora appendiculata TaxID=314037 RepID=A0AAE0X5L5_9PEZI|nr:hypothetical protein B0T22DRAFT_465279 [Podospora appendiculata]